MNEKKVEHETDTTPQPKTIEQMDMTELKALCYEQIMEINRVQNNINIIQAEIAKRGKAA